MLTRQDQHRDPGGLAFELLAEVVAVAVAERGVNQGDSWLFRAQFRQRVIGAFGQDRAEVFSREGHL
jgi:hypothetical protein